MVRIHPDPPIQASTGTVPKGALNGYPVVRSVVRQDGAVAQLGERLLCKQEVVGSIPSSSTSTWAWPQTSQ